MPQNRRIPYETRPHSWSTRPSICRERCRAQVRAVPLTVHFGDEELIDGVTIDRRRFYERLIESDVLPTTSQATPAAFVKEFEAVRQAGESAVVITISAELSGTYQSAWHRRGRL